MLVLRALGLGDLATAVPALRALRRRFPGATMVLATPAVWAPLARLTGAVDAVLPTGGLGELRVDQPPDVAVNLHGSGPESTRDCLGTGAGTVWSHRHPEVPDLDGPDWAADLHEVRRWCRLVEHFGVPADPGDIGLDRPPVTGVPAGCAVVHPGASVAAKRWPVDRFAALARELADRGMPVVVTGSAAEVGLARAAAEGAGLPADRVLAGRLDVAELAALVAKARLVVCGDTGVAHLASAYATPSVVLFGPVSPAQWGPPADGPHRALWTGGVGNPHGDTVDAGLAAIGVEEVLVAVDEVLGA